MTYCQQKSHLKYNNIGRLKAEGWKRTYYTNTNYKKDGVAILISYKVFQNK